MLNVILNRKCKMFRVKFIKQLCGVFLFVLCCMIVSAMFEFITGFPRSTILRSYRGAFHLKFPDSAVPRTEKSTQLAGHAERTAIPMKIQRPPQFQENSRGLINVQELCKEENFEHESTYEHGRFMQNRSVYYCYIPKCGTTFMELFLAKVFTNDTTNRKYYTEVTGKIELPDAYSFTFVREPYGRLFSAYENKLFHPNEMWKKLGTDVIRVVRPKASPLSQLLGHDVTFTELVQYVVTLHEQRQPLNPHLAPMTSICDPCKKRFDFIGRLEAMTEDLEYLVDQWKYREIVPKDIQPVVHIESETVYWRNFGRIYHMFNTLKKYNNLLSRYKLFQRTWSSYQMRGVILKTFEMPFTEFEVGEVNSTRYQEAVKTAIEASKDFREELKAQRLEAQVQAYKTVPLDLMFKLRQFVKTDCNLYGYDDKPNALFIRSVISSADEHNYFEGL